MKANRRDRHNMGLAGDDTAVMQVMEAIMAAMILMGAILFVTGTSNPVRESGAPGINLGIIAGDTLDVLQNQPGLDDGNITRLEEIIELAMTGDTDSAETFLGQAVPQGTRYALRLDNGYGSLQLLPTGSSTIAPRDASGASVFFLPNWTANSGASTSYVPGEELDFSSWSNLTAPDGSQIGPGGKYWLDIWEELEPDEDRVPASIPYGVWDCSGGSCADFRVVLDADTVPYRPMYSVQLLLWEGVS